MLLIGRTSAGTNTDFCLNGNTMVFPTIANASGVINKMYFQTKVANPSLTQSKIGLYADNGSGGPGAFLGAVAAASGFTGTGVYSADFSSLNIAIVAGTKYHIGASGVGEQFDIQGSGGGGTEITGNFPNPIVGTGSMTQVPICWAEDSGRAAILKQSIPFMNNLRI